MHATCGAKLPPLRGNAQTLVCSSTPPSTSGTPRMQLVVLTARTHAPNTCTSTTRHATCHPSTCSSSWATTTSSTWTHTVTPSKSCSPRKKFLLVTPTTQRKRSAKTAACSVSLVLVTQTSARCSWHLVCHTTPMADAHGLVHLPQ